MLVAQRKIHPVVAALLANIVLKEPLKVVSLEASLHYVSSWTSACSVFCVYGDCVHPFYAFALTYMITSSHFAAQQASR